MPCSRDPKRPTSISLSPAVDDGSLCGWDDSTLPQQTSPALQELGPENVKTFKAKSIVPVYILKKLSYTCASNLHL